MKARREVKAAEAIHAVQSYNNKDVRCFQIAAAAAAAAAASAIAAAVAAVFAAAVAAASIP